ncbi:MAG: hypothetical protein HYV99_05155, partial [Betaproteobacteria bacterium]|nr:hypothetical protein [Betaproteobacteria bacterium]
MKPEAAIIGIGESKVGQVPDRSALQLQAAAAQAALADAVERPHAAQPLRPGIDREELRRALPPHAPAALAEWALESLLAEGRIE